MNGPEASCGRGLRESRRVDRSLRQGRFCGTCTPTVKQDYRRTGKRRASDSPRSALRSLPHAKIPLPKPDRLREVAVSHSLLPAPPPLRSRPAFPESKCRQLNSPALLTCPKRHFSHEIQVIRLFFAISLVNLKNCIRLADRSTNKFSSFFVISNDSLVTPSNSVDYEFQRQVHFSRELFPF